MSNKTLLPNRLQCNSFAIKRISPKKDIKLLEELLMLYSKNKKHLRFWQRGEPELLFNSTEDYLDYLTKSKLFCYVLLISGKIIGCIEIGHLYIDALSFKYRYITFWIDKYYTRKGIMFNALSNMEDTLRSQNIDYLLADVVPKNKPSKKLLEKLFYFIKTKHSYMFDNGKTETFLIEFRKNLIDLPSLDAKEHELCLKKCLYRIEQCKKHLYKKLNLSSLHITKLPEELSELNWLKELDLSYNKLDCLPEWIGDFSELTVLNLRYNNLTKLPDSIIKLQRLKTINLGLNNFKSFPVLFGSRISLEII